MRFVFLAAACVSIAATITICIFLFANGVPAMLKIGLKNFIFGLKWKSSIDLYGIFPMIDYSNAWRIDSGSSARTFYSGFSCALLSKTALQFF